MTSPATIPIESCWDQDSPNLVDCLSDIIDVGREYDAMCGQVTRNFSLCRKGRQYIAAYGGVVFASPELWDAVEGLYRALREEVDNG